LEEETPGHFDRATSRLHVTLTEGMAGLHATFPGSGNLKVPFMNRDSERGGALLSLGTSLDL